MNSEFRNPTSIVSQKTLIQPILSYCQTETLQFKAHPQSEQNKTTEFCPKNRFLKTGQKPIRRGRGLLTKKKYLKIDASYQAI